MEDQNRKGRLERDLAALNQLLVKAVRESRGRADDVFAERLLKQLIRQRRQQLRACN